MLQINFRNTVLSSYCGKINNGVTYLKNYYRYLFILIPLFSIGCSPTYTLKDYSSKEKFYKDFNNFAVDKNLRIIFINDTSITAPYGAVISNDTLNAITNVQKIEKTLTKSEIKEINYYYTTNFTHPDFKVILKNGKELKEKNIVVLPDSSVEYIFTKNTHQFFPIYKIKEVKYKNRWLGIIPGLLGGFGSGVVIGIPISFAELANHHDKGDYENIWALYISAAAGTTIGIIAGWLIGNDYTYQFNP